MAQSVITSTLKHVARATARDGIKTGTKAVTSNKLVGSVITAALTAVAGHFITKNIK